MQSNKKEKNNSISLGRKATVTFLLFSIIGFGLITPTKPAQAAGLPVVDIVNKIGKVIKEAWEKGGSLAFQVALRSMLNKIAYETANYVGSGGRGQKPLFVTEGWGAYITQSFDEAAGTYLESFLKNLSESGSKNLSGYTMNFCQPSSIQAKLKISLGLTEQMKPKAPACTASKMVENWGDAAKRYRDFTSPDFLSKLTNIFDPVSSDLGIYWEASMDMLEKGEDGQREAQNKLLAKGGWLDPMTIDGKPISLPNQAQLQTEADYAKYTANFAKYTGQAGIDALNVFLNQLALSSFNRLMQTIAKKTGSQPSDYSADPYASSGEGSLKSSTVQLIQAKYNIKSDYNVLAELAICLDPRNPGPNDCVIDNNFMQAVLEELTVAEAIEAGYLNGSWNFEIYSTPGSYQNAYTWRNVSILRKYRIVPASWEMVFEKMKLYNDAIETNDSNLPEGASYKQATLRDLISCFSPYDGYNQFSEGFDALDQAWCTGLVDPNWVLKAPLNFCRKEGIGPHILNKTIIPSYPASNDNPYEPSTLDITRAENYCADQQTCIKEDDDGKCLAYGYCTEEKRTWNFEGSSCEAIDNTCQSFISPDNSARVSYLKNTLDYEGCSAENSGCKQYSTFGTYNPDNDRINWSSNSTIYLNDKTESCSNQSEGCSEIIRIKPAWGDNLVMNADFENDTEGDQKDGSYLNDWPVVASQAEIVESFTEPGDNFGKAIKLSGSNTASVFSNVANSLIPAGYSLVLGQAYTLSADVYISQGDSATVSLGTGASSSNYQTQSKGVWRHISVTKVAGDNFTNPSFSINFQGSNILAYVKDIKFEMSSWDTGFTPYGSRLSYQKILPEYLENACYQSTGAGANSYQLRPDAPAQCYNYARLCSQNDVGCELYTNVENARYQVPGKVSSSDYCRSECVGYDMYFARETNFFSTQVDNLIPRTATSCTAEAVGCTEFTNLDDVAIGGENKEYYSALKYCVKPGQAECADFYAWERTSSGSQLKLFTLKAGSGGAPATITNDFSACNAEVFNAGINSPLYNPDCQEFYSTSGQIFYRLNSQVISCSDDCRAYRMTEKNYDYSLTRAECSGADKNWDGQEGACVACMSGGTWSDEHQSCIYQGIPNEGKTCEASANSCREYNGSAGNNIKLIASYDFEGSSADWSSNCSNGISLADVSSDRDGQSLLYNNSASSCADIGENRQNLASKPSLIKQLFANDNVAAQLTLGRELTQGKAYNIKFWAKTSTGGELKAYLYNPDTKERVDFNQGRSLRLKQGDTWQIYNLSLEALDHSPSTNEMLVITADNSFYLDNVIVTEITDRYYLIKSSSQVPNSCYYDIFDNYQGDNYNLGCDAYQDRAKTLHNLRSFSEICAQSAVGCEQVISTENYYDYDSGIWGDLNGNGVCDSDEVDCVTVDADNTKYLVFDATKQCNPSDIGCMRMGESSSLSASAPWIDVYKKNQPNRYEEILCEQLGVGCQAWQLENGGFSYFRNPGQNVCEYRTGALSPAGQKAWYRVVDEDTPESLCPISYVKTIGYAGEMVPVPSQDAGLCRPEASSCSEYLDPVSSFNPNLFAVSSTANIPLKRNSLYVLTTSNTSTVELSFINSGNATTRVAPLLSDNTFAEAQASARVKDREAVVFNSLEAVWARLESGDRADVSLREVAISYQISSQLDKSSCNGRLDFNQGCVLFNERSFTGASGYANLAGQGFDPYRSSQGSSPVICDPNTTGSCATNQLIKVRPDRTCGMWLSCATYAIDEETGQKVCYDLKECNAVDEFGECVNFVDPEYTYNPANATGYYIPGLDNISKMQEVGLNSNAHFDFEDLVPAISCTSGGLPCASYSFTDFVVREPEGSPVDYPASGKSFLKVPNGLIISPQADGQFFNLSAGHDYYLSFLVNTEKSGGAQAKIEIKAKNATNGVVAYASANHGWERKIIPFGTEKIISGNSDYSAVSLYLSSSGGASGEVYFDDIRIEPVLKKGVNEFAVRDCRLYPNIGSFECSDYNKNVITTGLEGYCLEYDRDNPNNCITWYPADRISSSFAGSSLGYSERSGLSYCTNINSNIKFVRKLSTKLISRRSNAFVYIEPPEPEDPEAVRPPGYWQLSGSVADAFNLPIRTSTGSCRELTSNKNLHESYCGTSGDYRSILVLNQEDSNTAEVYCVPNDNKRNVDDGLVFGVGARTTAQGAFANATASSCDMTFYRDAWFYYDGKMNYESVKGCAGSGEKCEPIDEQGNADPAIRVYNPDYRVYDEQGLQYISADREDRDKLFNFSCSNFVQLVSSAGENQAWTSRVGVTADPEYSYDTPPFMNPNNNLKGYGRLALDAPYGAASFDANYDIVNSGAIYLRNQYYEKDPRAVYAGRPYACSGNSCANVGVCELNTNAFCIYYPDPENGDESYQIINNKSCSDGGFGTCIPLWSVAPKYPDDAQNALGNIFRTSYGAFVYRNGRYVPDPTGNFTIIMAATSGPQISNITLTRISDARAKKGQDLPNYGSGVYALSFNTTVDKDRQPLNMIHIDWGDESSQAITGVDHKPQPGISSDSMIHKFNHYYVNKTGTVNITIQIWDNWGGFVEASASL